MRHTFVDGGCTGFRQVQHLHRREFLRVGGLSALGLSLPALLQAEARAADYGFAKPPARAKSCILLFISGGPSQFETFDPKPEAAADYRGIFGAIPTNVPGTLISAELPQLAKLADRYALIRSAWHRYGGHFGGHRYALTGHPAPGNADQPLRADDKPGILSLAAKHLPPGNIPPAFMLPWVATDQGNTPSGGMNGGTLGRQFDPVRIEVDNASLDKAGQTPVFRVPEFALQPGITSERFQQRRHLLELIEAQSREMATSSTAREMTSLHRKACDLLTSPKIREGFEIEKEAAGLRERYGLNAYGQSCLMARRLIERGARFVQVNFARTVTQKSYGWDTHGEGRKTLKDHLLPKLDAGTTTLLSDLQERGLLKETLVVCMGEFGRTPKVKSDGGRDHWPQCYSLLLAGGGIHGGLTLGKSDKTGAYPAADPVEAREILVTIATLLGVPTFQVDLQGRAAPLFEGVEPVQRLYA